MHENYILFSFYVIVIPWDFADIYTQSLRTAGLRVKDAKLDAIVV